MPETADPDAPPDWRIANESGEYSWHDHRVHYMGQGTPPQVDDESVRTKVFDYAVPLEVGDERVEVAGTLYWVGEDDGLPLLPFIGLGVLALACVVAVLADPAPPADDGPAGPKEAKEAW